jgi:hypothetical protein
MNERTTNGRNTRDRRLSVGGSDCVDDYLRCGGLDKLERPQGPEIGAN